jgi:putative oxidoreductase
MLNLREIYGSLERFPLSIILFLSRVSIGLVFWNSGMTKIASWDITIVLFRDEYAVPFLPPEIAAALATMVELSCPILLLLGLMTRLATLPLIGMTLVIQLFVYPESWSVHLIWTTILLLILTRGPGALSLDYLVARRVWTND